MKDYIALATIIIINGFAFFLACADCADNFTFVLTKAAAFLIFFIDWLLYKAAAKENDTRREESQKNRRY